jgi:hypothetical protein
MTSYRDAVAGLIHGAQGPPAVVDKYLLPQESYVLCVRRHPAILIPWITRALGGLLIAWIMSDTLLSDDPPLLILVWLLWGYLLVQLALNLVNWFDGYFVATNERVLVISGVITRKVAALPLATISDVDCERSLAGRLVGYGRLLIESSSQSGKPLTVDYVPYPEQIYLEVCGLLSPAVSGQRAGAQNVGEASVGKPNASEPNADLPDHTDQPDNTELS